MLLTTHYLDEADQLADQISVVDRGRVIASGTPAELKARVGGSQIDVVVRADGARGRGRRRRAGVRVGRRSTPTGAGSPAPPSDPVAALGSVLRGL